MLFCSICGNLLLVQQREGNQQEFFCQTCPYICPIKKKIGSKVEFCRKKIDDILGGEDAWKNVDKTDVTCPKCENSKAFFMQIQIRSADEPSSLFYRCCNSNCAYQWREG